MKFAVTYEITTPESAEHGDAEERGYVCEDSDLRSALRDLHETRTSRVDGVECIDCDSYPTTAPRWITVCNGMEFLTGANESRSLHLPAGITPASARRVARLAGARLAGARI